MEYKVKDKVTGRLLGVFNVSSPAEALEALEALARHAGYASYATACIADGVAAPELSVEPQGLRVLVYEPAAYRGELRELDGSLESLQAVVGGHIEVVRAPFVSPLMLVINEEGLLLGLPLNRCGRFRDLVGTFFVVRTEGEDFVSLTDEDVDTLRRFVDLRE